GAGRGPADGRAEVARGGRTAAAGDRGRRAPRPDGAVGGGRRTAAPGRVRGPAAVIVSPRAGVARPAAGATPRRPRRRAAAPPLRRERVSPALPPPAR